MGGPASGAPEAWTSGSAGGSRPKTGQGVCPQPPALQETCGKLMQVSAGWTEGLPQTSSRQPQCRPKARCTLGLQKPLPLLPAQRAAAWDGGTAEGPQAVRLGPQDQICLGSSGSANNLPYPTDPLLGLESG